MANLKSLAKQAQGQPRRGVAALLEYKGDINTKGTGLVYRVATCMPLTAKAKKKAKPIDWTLAQQSANSLAELIENSANQGFSAEDFNLGNSKGQTPLWLAAERNLPSVITALVKLGVSVDLCDKQGVTPLLCAVQCGNTEAAVALLEAGCRGNLMDKKGNVPLRQAVLSGDIECAAAILATGKLNVDIITNEKQQTCLMHCLTSFKPKEATRAAQVLCAYGPDLTVEVKGKSPLVICSEKWAKQPSICSAVASADSANPVLKDVLNLVDKQGETMLYKFAKAKMGPACGSLIEKGADPTIVPKGGASLMVTAVQNGLVGLVRPIIKVLHDALGDTDELGNPVAMLAAYRTDPMEVRWWMKLFIEEKHDLSGVKVPQAQIDENIVLAQKSKLNLNDGAVSPNSLLMELVRRGHVDAASLLWDYLIDCGHTVDHNETDIAGRSLLFYSVYRKHYNDRTRILERILNCGVDLEQKDEENTTPLLAACRAENFKAVLRLLNQPAGKCKSAFAKAGGFNIDGHKDTTWEFTTKWEGCGHLVDNTDALGNTPLLYAAMHQNSYMMLALLAAGAEPDCLNPNTGMSPLMWAVRGSAMGSFPLCRTLVEAGANVTMVDKQGRNVVDFCLLHEFAYSERPLTKYLQSCAGGDFQFDKKTQALLDAETAYNSAGDNKSEAKQKVQQAYNKATEKFPDYTNRLADRVLCMYERSKAMINDLQKSKAKVVAAKATLVAVKLGMMFGGGADTAFLDIGFEMLFDLWIDNVLDSILGNIDLLLEMDCSLVFDVLEICDTPSRVKKLVEGNAQEYCETAIDAYEVAKRNNKPVNMREYGIDRYFDFMNWKTRKSLLKPLKYYSGPKELKQPKQKKGKLLALRPGERCIHKTTAQQLVVLSADKKNYTLESTADHTLVHYHRDDLRSEEVGEEKPRGDLQFSVHYDPTGFGELIVTCHGMKGVSASKSNGCQYHVKDEGWVAKSAMGKPLKSKYKKSEKWETLPENDHTFHLHGVKDIKDDSTLSIILKCDRKVGVGSMLVGGVSFYVKDLLKSGAGAYQHEWVGLFSDFEPERLQDEEVEEVEEVEEEAEVAVKLGASDFHHLGKDAHADVVELASARMRRKPDNAFDLEAIVPRLMPMDFTTPHLKVAQLKALDALYAKMAKQASAVIAGYNKQQLVETKLLEKDALYGGKAMMTYEKKGFKAAHIEAVKTRKASAKSNLTKAEKSDLEEEAMGDAKARFFEGAEYKRAKEFMEKRQFLAASSMERLRCRCLVEVYDLQLLFLNGVVVRQQKMLKGNKIPKDQREGAVELCKSIQEAVEGKLAQHYSSQVCNDRIFHEDFDFHKDWQKHDVGLNKAGGHTGKSLASKGSAVKPEKKGLRRRLSSVHLSNTQLTTLRDQMRGSTAP